MIHLLNRSPRRVRCKQVKDPARNKAQGPSTTVVKERRRSYSVSEVPLTNQEELALAEIRKAQAKPIAMSSDDVVAFEAFRGKANIGDYRSTSVQRNGVTAFRRKGVSGNSLPMPPAQWDRAQALAAHQATLNKLNRRAPDPRLAAQARAEKAKKRATPVIEALKLHHSLGHRRCAHVASITGEPIAYVRRIYRECVHDAYCP